MYALITVNKVRRQEVEMKRQKSLIKKCKIGYPTLKILFLPFYILLLTLFLYSSVKFTTTMIKDKNEQNAFKKLSMIVSESAPSLEYDIFQDYNILPQYIPLVEMNTDFFGWISIEGTNIDYPVMYSPYKSDFYLNHAFDGSSSRSGVPFIDSRCSESGNYYIIYAHHMRNTTMFGMLPLYAEQSYYYQHPVICFDTLYEKRQYNIIAAFYSRVYGDDEKDVFRYYDYFDLSDKGEFDKYMDEVKKASIYDTGFAATYGDEILVLSTCNYHTTDGRFVVVAVRKQP